MKKYKIVNRTRFRIFITVIVCVCFAVFSFFDSFSRAGDISSDLKYEHIYVKSGDTVWSIASSYNHEKSDPRDMVAEIRAFNNLDDLIIRPGDVIKIPIRKK